MVLNIYISIYKEHIGYGKEAEYQQKRIDKLIAENADEADVRKQVSFPFFFSRDVWY